MIISELKTISYDIMISYDITKSKKYTSNHNKIDQYISTTPPSTTIILVKVLAPIQISTAFSDYLGLFEKEWVHPVFPTPQWNSKTPTAGEGILARQQCFSQSLNITWPTVWLRWHALGIWKGLQLIKVRQTMIRINFWCTCFIFFSFLSEFLRSNLFDVIQHCWNFITWQLLNLLRVLLHFIGFQQLLFMCRFYVKKITLALQTVLLLKLLNWHIAASAC